MANWFMKTRTWNDTIVWLNQAIKIQPEFFEAHFLFGEVHLELGQFEKAIEAYRKAIQLRPNDPTPQVKLGYAYIALNDWTSAQRQYQALRQLNEVVANELFDKIVYSFNYGMFESLFSHMQEAK
jgi:tetratricopeptide (TPR) repeat protein